MEQPAQKIFQAKRWAGFLDGFGGLGQTWQEARLQDFRLGLGHLRNGYQAIRSLQAVSDRALAPEFNLFRVLGRESDEVRTHIPFLQGLLDPTGSHGQGDLFLRSLWRRLAELDKGLPGDLCAPARVFREYAAGQYGRLDILIESPAALVAMEVKVYAGEQEDQLARYAAWLARRARGRQGVVSGLFFLTLSGHDSGTASGAAYNRLSFKGDVRHWLLECLAKVEARRVRMAIRQYLELLASL